MSVQPLAAASTTAPERLPFGVALLQIASRAGELDQNPRFPRENFADLAAAGIPQLAGAGAPLSKEIGLVRALASADASTARILDGHLNGAERVSLCADGALRQSELAAIAAGRLLLGVWGADPAPGEGAPAHLVQGPDGLALDGVKTFCSGAGGVQRALVIARDEEGSRRVAYVDVTRNLRIDRDWYRASGLRASESHRVEFLHAPVLAVLGGSDELLREPWFSRDAIRSAATWAGIADLIIAATTETLRRGTPDQSALLGLGRMQVAQGTIDRWLDWAGSQLSDLAQLEQDSLGESGGPRAVAAETRIAISDAARLIAAEAARACGARALVGASSLDRARRDLDLFLLQHRLDPKLVELAAARIEEARA